MNKRILALLLALVMAVGALPTGVGAADTGDTLVVSDSEAKVVTNQQKEQASTKVATATKNTGGKPTQTQSQTVGESGDGPSTFATNTFHWNISEDDIWEYLYSNGKEPKPATLYTGQQDYYFNIWWTGDAVIEEVELFVKWPGEKKFHSYGYWQIEDSKKYEYTLEKFYTVGTVSYYWEVTYKNGSIQKLDVTSASVYKGDNYIWNVSNSYTGRISTGDDPYWHFFWERKYSDKARSLSLEAYAAEGKIKKFKSNSKKVTVNSKGKVTIAKRFVGRVIISVYLPATENFNASVEHIEIHVIPKTPTITKVSSPKKGQMKVSWKKDTNCSGYEIMYSTDKKFLKAKSITIKKNSVSSVVVKGMKRRKKYYVKMLSYKEDKSDVGLYSEHSKTKSIKIK